MFFCFCLHQRHEVCFLFARRVYPVPIQNFCFQKPKKKIPTRLFTNVSAKRGINPCKHYCILFKSFNTFNLLPVNEWDNLFSSDLTL